MLPVAFLQSIVLSSQVIAFVLGTRELILKLLNGPLKLPLDTLHGALTFILHPLHFPPCLALYLLHLPQELLLLHGDPLTLDLDLLGLLTVLARRILVLKLPSLQFCGLQLEGLIHGEELAEVTVQALHF